MRIIILLALAFCSFLTMPGHAQKSPARAEDAFEARSITVDGRDYAYRVYRSPALAEGEAAPALLFLHGRGECGTDNLAQLRVGLPPAVLAHPERWPFVIIAPQKPRGEEEWETHEAALVAMLKRAVAEDGVDRARVAITGLSQGGHGTIAMSTRHPGLFRAAAPVCAYVAPFWTDGERRPQAKPEGEEKARLVESFRTTPVWLFHGGKDDVVPPGESEWLHDELTAAGLDSRLTIFPHDNHNSWDSAYGGAVLAAWLVERTE